MIVHNGRWEFRWDVPGRIVAAWSTALLDQSSSMAHAGLVLESQALLRWAQSHKAEIREEAEAVLQAQLCGGLRGPGAGAQGTVAAQREPDGGDFGLGHRGGDELQPANQPRAGLAPDVGRVPSSRLGASTPANPRPALELPRESNPQLTTQTPGVTL